jgi:hypothetical protein
MTAQGEFTPKADRRLLAQTSAIDSHPAPTVPLPSKESGLTHLREVEQQRHKLGHKGTGRGGSWRALQTISHIKQLTSLYSSRVCMFMRCVCTSVTWFAEYLQRWGRLSSDRQTSEGIQPTCMCTSPHLITAPHRKSSYWQWSLLKCDKAIAVPTPPRPAPLHHVPPHCTETLHHHNVGLTIVPLVKWVLYEAANNIIQPDK